MRTRIKLALILVHMTSASNEQRRTKSVSCELPGLGSAEGTERPGLQKKYVSRKSANKNKACFNSYSYDERQ